MDQDYFRSLLASSSTKPTSSQKITSGWGTSSRKTKNTPKEDAQPAFQPRKVKKNDDTGARPTIDLSEYEKLGSAKGLDMSLLQTKPTTPGAETVDDELEEIFLSADRDNDVLAKPKKRTREEIIHDLKRKRQKEGVDKSNSASPVQESRFKPIGKPVKKVKTVKKVGKKDIDVPSGAAIVPNATNPEPETSRKSVPRDSKPENHLKPIDEEPVEDIFAGVGDYDGLSDDEDEGDSTKSDADKEDEKSSGKQKDNTNQPKSVAKANWFNDLSEEDEVQLNSESATQRGLESEPISSMSIATAQDISNQHPQNIERLAPLSSSHIHSISEFLEVDKSLETEEKRRERREKRKGKKREG